MEKVDFNITIGAVIDQPRSLWRIKRYNQIANMVHNKPSRIITTHPAGGTREVTPG